MDPSINPASSPTINTTALEPTQLDRPDSKKRKHRRHKTIRERHADRLCGRNGTSQCEVCTHFHPPADPCPFERCERCSMRHGPFEPVPRTEQCRFAMRRLATNLLYPHGRDGPKRPEGEVMLILERQIDTDVGSDLRNWLMDQGIPRKISMPAQPKRDWIAMLCAQYEGTLSEKAKESLGRLKEAAAGNPRWTNRDDVLVGNFLRLTWRTTADGKAIDGYNLGEHF